MQTPEEQFNELMRLGRELTGKPDAIIAGDGNTELSRFIRAAVESREVLQLAFNVIAAAHKLAGSDDPYDAELMREALLAWHNLR